MVHGLLSRLPEAFPAGSQAPVTQGTECGPSKSEIPVRVRAGVPAPVSLAVGPKGSLVAFATRDLERFWSRVDRSGSPDACWPWTGGVSSSGYGRIMIDGAALVAHRFACGLANGNPPANGLEACHSTRCTTRLCCNGTHLRWDTHLANMADAVSNGHQCGVNNAKAVLTEDLVKIIWERRRDGATAIARGLGVSRDAVTCVIYGATWRHVTHAAPPAWARVPPARRLMAARLTAPVASVLLLALSAVGCDPKSRPLSDEQRCQAACAPRPMHEMTLWSCVCDSLQPDGGGR